MSSLANAKRLFITSKKRIVRLKSRLFLAVADCWLFTENNKVIT
ncbi:hypothetical protein PROVRETT_06301 [Providencia rettgeri DSM 1131]|nr:hypothetical protein PROVRETT_06301 [Providencia rettgeri DSM 1131]